MKRSYSEFISICNSKGLSIQYRELPDSIRKTYLLFTYDGQALYECKIDEESNIVDFESNHKSDGNKKLQPIETTTGWLKIRNRTVSGDTQLKYLYFTTSTTSGFDNAGDSDYTITVNAEGTKTIVDFCPEYDYEIAGGRLRALATDMAGNSVKINFILVPDIPAQYGGNYYVISNKKLDNDEKFFILNEEPKYVYYRSATPTASKVRLEINHNANEQWNFEYNLRIYRV